MTSTSITEEKIIFSELQLLNNDAIRYNSPISKFAVNPKVYIQKYSRIDKAVKSLNRNQKLDPWGGEKKYFVEH